MRKLTPAERRWRQIDRTRHKHRMAQLGLGEEPAWWRWAGHVVMTACALASAVYAIAGL